MKSERATTELLAASNAGLLSRRHKEAADPYQPIDIAPVITMSQVTGLNLEIKACARTGVEAPANWNSARVSAPTHLETSAPLYNPFFTSLYIFHG